MSTPSEARNVQTADLKQRLASLYDRLTQFELQLESKKQEMKVWLEQELQKLRQELLSDSEDSE